MGFSDWWGKWGSTALTGGIGLAGSIIGGIQSRKVRRENERRLQRVMNMWGESRDRSMRAIEGYGSSGRGEIDRRFTNIGTKAGQDLVSRGLSASTVAPTVQASIGREKSSALGALDDRLARMRMDVDRDYTGQMTGVLERVENEYPDNSWLDQLWGSFGRSIASTRRG